MNDPKSVLRVLLRKEYADMDDADRNRTDADIMARVQEFTFFRNCSRIFLFASVGNEINTHELIRYAFSVGKTVLLPKCLSKGVMEFYEYEGTLTVGKFGICEPTGTRHFTPNSDDLMIVPGLSFTADGLRLGQGGGYYDRYLEKYPCVTVGLCREKFLKIELPTAWNDLPVDYVITEKAVYECKNGAS